MTKIRKKSNSKKAFDNDNAYQRKTKRIKKNKEIELSDVEEASLASNSCNNDQIKKHYWPSERLKKKFTDNTVSQDCTDRVSSEIVGWVGEDDNLLCVQ